MKSKAKTLALLNAGSVLLVVICNYWIGVKGYNGNTVASMSESLNNYFVPASYAFSIWGIIFMALIASGIYQIKVAFSDQAISVFISKMGPWFLLANVGNCLWLWAWLSNKIGLSVLIMLTILVSLIMLILRLGMEVRDEDKPIKLWVWWPIQLYAGWIAVATIANVAAYLTKIEWQALFGEITWGVIMILVAALVNILILYFRNTRVFVLAGIWALVAIAIRHWDSVPPLQWAAALGALLLLGNVMSRSIRATRK